VKLELHDAGGQLLSDNLYWLAANSATYRELNELPTALVTVTPERTLESGRSVNEVVRLENRSSVPALETKLTLLDSRGERILPVYYSENYISLLPGERREITIDYASSPAQGTPQIAIRGWNVKPAIIK
jgi:Exo-beta-D-glucosaminidase Ig-fold domain